MAISVHERMHSSKLIELCRPAGLEKIDILPGDVRIIIKEPIVERQGWGGLQKSPDLFIGNYDKTWNIVELKRSARQRRKAYIQVECGAKMLVDIFGIPLKYISGRLVIYSEKDFKYEMVPL